PSGIGPDAANDGSSPRLVESVAPRDNDNGEAPARNRLRRDVRRPREQADRFRGFPPALHRESEDAQERNHGQIGEQAEAGRGTTCLFYAPGPSIDGDGYVRGGRRRPGQAGEDVMGERVGDQAAGDAVRHSGEYHREGQVAACRPRLPKTTKGLEPRVDTAE